MGNDQSLPAMAEEVEVEEVQKLKKELEKRKKEKKRNGKNIGREREAEGGNLTFK